MTTLLALLLACATPTPVDPVPEPVPVEARAAVAPTWTWDETPGLFPDGPLVAGEVWFSVPDAEGRSRLSAGERWSVDPGFERSAGDLGGAALAVDGDRVFLAYHNRIATGCELGAWSLKTGERLWLVGLEGIGPIGHSKYSNRVQLRVIDGRPTVSGWEASGRYVEVRDPQSGALEHNEKLDGEVPEIDAVRVAESLFHELVAVALKSSDSAEIDGKDFVDRHVYGEPDGRLDRAVVLLQGAPLPGQRGTLRLSRDPSGAIHASVRPPSP